MPVGVGWAARVCHDGGVSKTERPPLRLAQSDSADMDAPWVGGVASGVASRYGFPVGAVRATFGALSAVAGAGIIAYMWLWLTTPTDEQSSLDTEGQPSATEAFRSPMRAVGERRDSQVTAGRLLVVGSLFLLFAAFVAVIGIASGTSGPTFFWSIITVLGLLMVWLQAPRIAGRAVRPIGFVVLGTLMVVVGTVAVLAANGQLVNVGSGLIAALAVLVVATIALAPLGMRVVKDLTVSRSREAREVERADIAAHLHDSVLQTLTLIRGAADDPARVRALALTQERELRSWLYTGSVEAAVSVAEALKEQAADVEATYGVAIDVVTVGDTVPGPRQLAAIAAAGEAMTNAVRHGATPITVFQEARGGDLEIFVKDAGDGFDMKAIPDDRHGLRNSILGRVSRVGGKVEVRFLPPVEVSPWSVPEAATAPSDTEAEKSVGGTEIRIFLPHAPDERWVNVARDNSVGMTPVAVAETEKRESA